MGEKETSIDVPLVKVVNCNQLQRLTDKADDG